MIMSAFLSHEPVGSPYLFGLRGTCGRCRRRSGWRRSSRICAPQRPPACACRFEPDVISCLPGFHAIRTFNSFCSPCFIESKALSRHQ